MFRAAFKIFGRAPIPPWSPKARRTGPQLRGPQLRGPQLRGPQLRETTKLTSRSTDRGRPSASRTCKVEKGTPSAWMISLACFCPAAKSRSKSCSSCGSVLVSGNGSLLPSAEDRPILEELRPLLSRLRNRHRLTLRKDPLPLCDCETVCPARCMTIVPREHPGPVRFDMDL